MSYLYFVLTGGAVGIFLAGDYYTAFLMILYLLIGLSFDLITGVL